MWLLADLLAVAVALTLHAAVCRSGRPGNTVLRFLIVGCLPGGLLLLWLASSYGFSPQLMAGVMVYAFFCELYIFLFTLALSSVSANLLLNLSYGRMTQGQIERRYDSSCMVIQRIDRMIATGLLLESNGVLCLTRRGENLLALLECLRRTFRHARQPTA